MTALTPPRVLLDCDPGIDDTLALIYLAGLHRAGEIELVAVTTTAGNADATLTAANATWILESCGVVNVPVAEGLPGPAARELVTTPETHGPSGLGYVTAPQRAVGPAEENAPKTWRELWEQAEGAHLIVTGPLTNAAGASELLDSFASITVMGGAVGYPGNTTPTAEWNFWVDPEAADLVLGRTTTGQAANPVTLCSLGVTEQFLVDPERLETICDALGDSPVAEPLPEILRFYFEFHLAHDQGYQAQIHDLLTCILALDRAPFDDTQRPLRVACDEQRRGSVVPVEGTASSQRGPETRVVTSADFEAAHEEFLRVCRILAELSVRGA